MGGAEGVEGMKQAGAVAKVYRPIEIPGLRVRQCPGETGVVRGRPTSGIMKRAATNRLQISMIASL